MSSNGSGLQLHTRLQTRSIELADELARRYSARPVSIDATEAGVLSAHLRHVSKRLGELEAACTIADDVFDELALHERGRCIIDNVDTCVRRIREKIGTYRATRAR